MATSSPLHRRGSAAAAPINPATAAKKIASWPVVRGDRGLGPGQKRRRRGALAIAIASHARHAGRNRHPPGMTAIGMRRLDQHAGSVLATLRIDGRDEGGKSAQAHFG